MLLQFLFYYFLISHEKHSTKDDYRQKPNKTKIKTKTKSKSKTNLLIIITIQNGY